LGAEKVKKSFQHFWIHDLPFLMTMTHLDKW
jgi:hypothetical protein